ncbi:hypothetical protein, partial [Segatella buccae]|uniref:hypothetical protein n=1 Tax=Segatella buccae TaxID=28126 RepID=UPI001E3150E3
CCGNEYSQKLILISKKPYTAFYCTYSLCPFCPSYSPYPPRQNSYLARPAMQKSPNDKAKEALSQRHSGLFAGLQSPL